MSWSVFLGGNRTRFTVSLDQRDARVFQLSYFRFLLFTRRHSNLLPGWLILFMGTVTLMHLLGWENLFLHLATAIKAYLNAVVQSKISDKERRTSFKPTHFLPDRKLIVTSEDFFFWVTVVLEYTWFLESHRFNTDKANMQVHFYSYFTLLRQQSKCFTPKIFVILPLKV